MTTPKLFLAGFLSFVVLQLKAQPLPKEVPGEYIIILKETAASPVIKNQKQNSNREQKAELNRPDREKNMQKIRDLQVKNNINRSSILMEFADVVVGFSAKLNDSEKKKLERDVDVEAVFRDYFVELDPLKPEKDPPGLSVLHKPENAGFVSSGIVASLQSGPYGETVDNSFVKNDSPLYTQYVPCGITMAGGFVDGRTKDTWIWIVDTGIDLDHPDLNVMANAPFARSFVKGVTVDDGNGHGTHCAGIAAAKNNAFGVVGVSAGATVVPVRALTNIGNGQFSWLVMALNHVAIYDKPGDVVNISIGGISYLDCENILGAMRDAVRNLGNAGTYVVMAAGNNKGNAAHCLPGCINGTNVYTVGGISCINACYEFSNWNTGSDNVVAWVAVGVEVYTTFKNGGYVSLSGTSMASPTVAGIIHARGGPPVLGGTINCKGKRYRIAKR